MDRTRERFAYRCLPLLIANQNGWFILNVHKIRCIWDGGTNESALRIACDAGPKDVPCPAASHFGHGVLTWNLNYLFRTSPGYNLWARGPANMFKPGIAPLEGIVETDWAVATFTMNWKMLAVNMEVEFLPGEPICMIVPVRRGDVERFTPKLRDLDTEADLKAKYEQWSASRSKFIQDLRTPQSQASEDKWQKDYFQGHVAGTNLKAPEHQVKLDVKEFQLPPPPPSS
jgi:hypothetical protein